MYDPKKPLLQTLFRRWLIRILMIRLCLTWNYLSISWDVVMWFIFCWVAHNSDWSEISKPGTPVISNLAMSSSFLGKWKKFSYIYKPFQLWSTFTALWRIVQIFFPILLCMKYGGMGAEYFAHLMSSSVPCTRFLHPPCVRMTTGGGGGGGGWRRGLVTLDNEALCKSWHVLDWTLWAVVFTDIEAMWTGGDVKLCCGLTWLLKVAATPHSGHMNSQVMEQGFT